MVQKGSAYIASARTAAVVLGVDFGGLLAHPAVGLDGVSVKVVGSNAGKIGAVDRAHLAGVCEGRTFDQGEQAGRGCVVHVNSLGGLNIDMGYRSSNGC